MISKSSNPFNTGSPTNPENFYGRFQIINEIYNFLDNPNQSTFLINGQRRIGKTSLLRKMQKEIRLKGFKPVYFDLQNKGELSLPEILYDLMEVINLELGIKNNLTLKDFKGDYHIFELNYIKEITSKNKNIVLLFDEFDILGDRKFIAEDENTRHLAYVRFVPYLQDIIEKRVKLKFIFAIGRTLNDLAEYYGPIKKFAQFHELTYFESNESYKLISSLSQNSIQYPKETIEKIHNVTFGHPYYLQCLSSYLFDKANDKQLKIIKPGCVDNQIIPAIKKYSGGLSWFWDGFKPEEKTYLFIIAQLQENNQPTDEQSISKKFEELQIKTYSPKFIGILSKLLDFTILKKNKDNKNYEITVPFIQKWIITEHSIESIYREVDKIDKLLKMYLDLGKLHMENEEYNEAVENFRKVLKRNPENFEAQYSLACALNYGNLAREEEIIEELEKAYLLDPVQTKESYISILKRFSEKLNTLEFFEKLLKINSADRNIQKKCLDLYFIKWKDDFNNKKYSSFGNTIKNNEWILSSYRNNVENFFEEMFENYFNNNRQELIIDCIDNVSESIFSVKFNKWIVKTFDSLREKKFEEGKKEGIEQGKNEGIKQGKKEGIEQGKNEGYIRGKKEGGKEGYTKGKREGKKEGIEQGKNEGYIKGKREGEKEGYTKGKRESKRDLINRFRGTTIFVTSSMFLYLYSFVFLYFSIYYWDHLKLESGIELKLKYIDLNIENLILLGLFNYFDDQIYNIIVWAVYISVSIATVGIPLYFNLQYEYKTASVFSMLFLICYPLISLFIFGVYPILLGFKQLWSSFSMISVLLLITFILIVGSLIYSVVNKRRGFY